MNKSEEEEKALRQEYYQKNKEKLNVYAKEYYKQNKERIKIRDQESYQRNKKQISVRISKARHRQYHRFHELVNSIKETKGCLYCGERCSVCLDFHHVDPSVKRRNISSMSRLSEKAVLAEVSKCVVMCRNCHAKLHWMPNRLRTPQKTA